MTYITNIKGNIRTLSSAPSNPEIGDEYFDTTQGAWRRWTGNSWVGISFTTTSTSTTTTTSTSTSTTSTTTSTSTSTTTSTSTSTTTTG